MASSALAEAVASCLRRSGEVGVALYEILLCRSAVSHPFNLKTRARYKISDLLR